MKKCMKLRVEGRRPVGRPRWTWLESVEMDMAEHEIDREDVHDSKKWRNNVMKRKSNPIGKTDCKTMIYEASLQKSALVGNFWFAFYCSILY